MDSQGTLRVFFFSVWKSSTFVRSLPVRSEQCRSVCQKSGIGALQKSPICSRAALTPKALSGVLKQNPHPATGTAALPARQNVTPELGSIRHRGLDFCSSDPHHKLQGKSWGWEKPASPLCWGTCTQGMLRPGAAAPCHLKSEESAADRDHKWFKYRLHKPFWGHNEIFHSLQHRKEQACWRKWLWSIMHTDWKPALKHERIQFHEWHFGQMPAHHNFTSEWAPHKD